MKTYLMDIEGNGLLDTLSHLWMIVLKQRGTDNVITFSDENIEGARPLAEFEDFVKNEIDLMVGHNILRYDAPAVEKVMGINLHKLCKIHDTMTMSKLNNFVRPQTNRRHSLKAWGDYLGFPKDEYDKGFEEYHPEMYPYCVQDVHVTEKVYEEVIREFKAIAAKKPKYKLAMQTEHELSRLSAQQTRDGWLFDFDACQALIDKITEEMRVIEEEVEPHLDDIERLVDKEPKTPKYRKDGAYTAASAKVISDFVGYTVSPEDALKANPPVQVGQEFQRTEIVKASLGNQDVVKEYIETLGWKPDEWNWKKINGQFIKTSPKFTEKSLLAVGHEHTNMINDYYTLRQRRSILQGFMEQSEGDGRIRGDVNDQGAQSFRQTHRVLANLPGAYAKYGPEIRGMFICPEGSKLVSADGAAYQIRILAHYLKSDEYTDIVLNGDPHQMHADRVGVTRTQAKGLFFATLFGAGGGKIGNMLGTNQKDGAEKRQKLLNGIPNMRALLNKITAFVGMNGFIPGPDGRRIYPESDYKSLNYLIQGTEACLMKLTWVRIAQAFEAEGIPYKQLLAYHDEITYEIPDEYVEQAEEIIRHWFAEAPKELGVELMEAGDVKRGSTYFEVH